MAVMTNRRSLPKTAEEWDGFLFKTYGHGLYPFVYAAVRIICKSNPCYRVGPGCIFPPFWKNGRAAEYKQIRNRIKRDKNLLKHMIRNYIKDLKFWRQPKEVKITKGDIEFIRKAHPEVEELERKIESDEDTLREKSLWQRKGHPTDTRNKIAAVFAQVIKKENGDRDWVVIHSLILWIWNRITKASYSKELADVNPVFTPETLKVAHAKIIKNPERRLDIERQVESCFPSFIVRPSDMLKIRKSRMMIKFEKKFITYDTIGQDQESRYPTIIFPDGEILKGMFNLKEAAAFLDVPPLFLERLCEKELVPYRQSEDEEEKTFSRTELMEWRREVFGDRPILKRKFAESDNEETHDRENLELRKAVAGPKVAHKLSKKEREPEKTITIHFTKDDSAALQKYGDLRERTTGN